jgi:hypothetical protein
MDRWTDTYKRYSMTNKHGSCPGIPGCGLDVLPQQSYHPNISAEYFVSTLLSGIKHTGHCATKGGQDTLQIVLQRLNRGDTWMNNDVSLSQRQQELLRRQEEEDDNYPVMDWSHGHLDLENKETAFVNSNPEEDEGLLQSVVPEVTVREFNEVAEAKRNWKGDEHNAFKSKVEEMNKMLSSSEATDEMWVQANKVLDTLNIDLMVKLQERYSQFAKQCKPCK